MSLKTAAERELSRNDAVGPGDTANLAVLGGNWPPSFGSASARTKPELFFSHGWNTDETRIEKFVPSFLRRVNYSPNSAPALEPNLVTNLSAISVQSVFNPWLNCIVTA